MNIDYDHHNNLHTQAGAEAALPFLFPKEKPSSLLDVGCGIGTWLAAALEFGIDDVYGVDGVAIPPDQLVVPPQFFKQQDLTQPLKLGRKFDVVLCLEVAEHLNEVYALNLIRSLVAHGDTIYFSAACPGQPGQHHVNCRWPEYWQSLFNEEGYVCNDLIRWKIWGNGLIEPWYRQNLFLAIRSTEMAGKEPRIASVVHPDMVRSFFNEREVKAKYFKELQSLIERGSESCYWYLRTPFMAIKHKTIRKIFPK